MPDKISNDSLESGEVDRPPGPGGGGGDASSVFVGMRQALRQTFFGVVISSFICCRSIALVFAINMDVKQRKKQDTRAEILTGMNNEISKQKTGLVQPVGHQCMLFG